MEVGYVKDIKGPIVYLDGLPTAKVGDLVSGENDVMGYVSGLTPLRVEVMILSAGKTIPGQAFHPTGKSLSVPVGDFLLGRAISPLGVAIDGKKPIPVNKDNLSPLEQPIPGVADRRFIREQFETGITLVDTLIPLGKGQRELIIGDARSGKTGFILDIIANQKKHNIICVYACIAKPSSDVFDLIKALEKSASLENTVFIASFSTDSSPLVFLTPQTALTIANYFQKQGKDVLVILDDMGAHAKVYREISLLSDRPPGREAYPGDIFYQHAHLMERAGNFASSVGGGSITALPVIELGLTGFTGFIPTNIMSMTDGHLLFSSGLYSQGRRPAVDLTLSVSRVGQQTQFLVQTELAYKIKSLLIDAERLITLTSFSTELPVETRNLLSQRSVILEILRQQSGTNISTNKQAVLLAMSLCKLMEGKDEKFIMALKDPILKALDENPKLAAFTQNVFNFSGADELITKLNELIPEITAVIQKSATPPAAGPISAKTILGADLPKPNADILEGKK